MTAIYERVMFNNYKDLVYVESFKTDYFLFLFYLQTVPQHSVEFIPTLGRTSNTFAIFV